MYNMVDMDTVSKSNKIRHVLICVVYNMVDMGTVSKSNKIWHVLDLCSV